MGERQRLSLLTRALSHPPMPSQAGCTARLIVRLYFVACCTVHQRIRTHSYCPNPPATPLRPGTVAAFAIPMLPTCESLTRRGSRLIWQPERDDGRFSPRSRSDRLVADALQQALAPSRRLHPTLRFQQDHERPGRYSPIRGKDNQAEVVHPSIRQSKVRTLCIKTLLHYTYRELGKPHTFIISV